MNFSLSIKQESRLDNYCPNISMEMMLTNTKNTKTNESNKFILYLTKRLDLRSSNKHATLQNLSVY